MFLRKSTRRYKGSTYTNFLLVESVRTPKGPRQRTVCSLGDLRSRPRQEWATLFERTARAVTGQGALFPGDSPSSPLPARAARGGCAPAHTRRGSPPSEAIGVLVDGVRTEEHREAGPVHVGVHFWKRLGVDSILRELGLKEPVRSLTCAMVMNRLIAPSSEHAMPDWIRSTALGDILGVDFTGLAEDALYRNMDRLHPHRANLEKELVERERSLFQLDQTVFLYDLTSTYFEGEALANPKARRGYSRDQRPDCKQVVVGLVVNREGFPLAHEVFSGNTLDHKTLDGMLDRLALRVGLAPGQTVVVDRGMAFDENLAQIRARKLHYIVASRHPERNQWLADFEDLEGFTEVVRPVSPTNPHQHKPAVKVKSKRVGDGMLVLCIGEGRVQKDRAIRRKHETRLLEDLKKLAVRVEKGRFQDAVAMGQAIGRLRERYPRVARYYSMECVTEGTGFRLQLQRDEARYATAEALDGCYILKTDRSDLGAEDIWRIYSLLTRAEHAFRDMKTPLAERPIFHQIERRVDTHIFLCLLAYHLLVSIEKTLRDHDDHTSWATVRDTLKTHQICTVVLPTSERGELRIRRSSTPEPTHTDIYRKLSVPTEVIQPQRSWTPGDEVAAAG